MFSFYMGDTHHEISLITINSNSFASAGIFYDVLLDPLSGTHDLP